MRRTPCSEYPVGSPVESTKGCDVFLASFHRFFQGSVVHQTS